MKVVVDYPDFGDELTVVQRSLAAAPELRSVISADSLRDLQRTAAGVYVDPHVATYAVTLTLATRRPASTALPTWSASSRTGRARVARSTSCTARALALLRGRAYVPQDVRDLAKDVLRHRLVLTYEALAAR